MQCTNKECPVCGTLMAKYYEYYKCEYCGYFQPIKRKLK